SLMKQKEEKQSRFLELQAEDKALIERQNQLAETHGTLVQSIQHSEEKWEELKAANEAQKQKEGKLYDKLHGLLADVSVPFTNSLLSNYSVQLEEMLEQNRQEGEQIKK